MRSIQHHELLRRWERVTENSRGDGQAGVAHVELCLWGGKAHVRKVRIEAHGNVEDVNAL